MSNLIRLHPQHENMQELLILRNTLTAALLEVLAMAGSILAETDWEKEFVVFPAEHDQTIVGLSCAGFTISKMPWTREGFRREKAFLLRVIEAARAKTGWDRLGFSPNEETVPWALDRFRELVDRFEEEFIEAGSDERQSADFRPTAPLRGYPRCPPHGVLLHQNGCVIRNNTILS